MPDPTPDPGRPKTCRRSRSESRQPFAEALPPPEPPPRPLARTLTPGMPPPQAKAALDLVRQGEIPLILVCTSNEAAMVWAGQHQVTESMYRRVRCPDDLIGQRHGTPWVLVDFQMPLDLKVVALGSLGQENLVEVA